MYIRVGQFDCRQSNLALFRFRPLFRAVRGARESRNEREESRKSNLGRIGRILVDFQKSKVLGYRCPKVTKMIVMTLEHIKHQSRLVEIRHSPSVRVRRQSVGRREVWLCLWKRPESSQPERRLVCLQFACLDERRVGSSLSEGRALVRIIIASQTTRSPSYSMYDGLEERTRIPMMECYSNVAPHPSSLT